MTCQLCYGKGYITGSIGPDDWTIGCDCITGEVDLFTFAKQIGFKETGDELIYELPQGDFYISVDGKVSFEDMPVMDATEQGLINLINAMR